ncbi:hypothetical protein [Mesorhizobium sp. B2-3-4]|uniref:hypothetical protein n=1 Tax=Mesorhizobium sp. B2-3-4 TaxID=2589959 RepID=UPI00112E794D|nr:hypothetical protein [Mesorhizobium sp. B2-3-4]TPM30862.1 hypothetical protein FJ967_25715 [Mesorhizobium sp. B2-3-4]
MTRPPRKILLVTSGADTMIARQMRQFWMERVRIYHPDASVPVTAADDDFDQIALVLLTPSLVACDKCLRFLEEMQEAGKEIVTLYFGYLNLPVPDVAKPRSLVFEVIVATNYEPARLIASDVCWKRFAGWLDKLIAWRNGNWQE